MFQMVHRKRPISDFNLFIKYGRVLKHFGVLQIPAVII